MAIYRASLKIVSRRVRDRSGKAVPGQERSAVAKSAYISASNLKDERQGKSHYYGNRKAEVLHAEITAPEAAPLFMGDRQALWNAVERCEKRVDSQLCREWVLAIPRELEDQQKIDLVRGWAAEFAREGKVIDWAVHHGRGKNPHCHALEILRPVDPQSPTGFGPKPDMKGMFSRHGSVGLAAKKELLAHRGGWEQHCNQALELAGRSERVSHLSREAQGLLGEPERKIGVAASAMKRRGTVADPERVKLARQARMEKMLAPIVSALRQTGEVPLRDGQTWWQRLKGLHQTLDQTFDRAREGTAWLGRKAGEMLRDESGEPSGRAWQDHVTARREDVTPER